MSIFIDSTIFLRLFLNEPGAVEAQNILELVEDNRVIGITTPMVLEEVSFKLLYAKLSEALDTTNIWRIREALRRDEAVRTECIKLLKKFRDYINYLSTKGLRVAAVTYDDWSSSLEIIEGYGLLPADSIHIRVALRKGVETIASFDQDFKDVEGLKTSP